MFSSLLTQLSNRGVPLIKPPPIHPEPFIEVFHLSPLSNSVDVDENHETPIKTLHYFGDDGKDRPNPLLALINEKADKAQKITLTIITHGYMSYIRNPNEHFHDIKDAVFAHHKTSAATSVNQFFLLLDWSSYSGNTVLDYFSVVKGVNKISKWVGHLLRGVRNEFKERAYIHGIGFSLGAHLIGNCSSVLGTEGASHDDEDAIIFDRITGLDPAGPCVTFKSGIFSFLSPTHETEKLSKKNAKFVDVIHTSDHLGTTEALGHVDFYVNWGTTQLTLQPPQLHLFPTFIQQSKRLEEVMSLPINPGYLNISSHIYCLKLFYKSITEKDKYVTKTRITDLEKRVTKEEDEGELVLGYFCGDEGKEGMYYFSEENN